MVAQTYPLKPRSSFSSQAWFGKSLSLVSLSASREEHTMLYHQRPTHTLVFQREQLSNVLKVACSHLLDHHLNQVVLPKIDDNGGNRYMGNVVLNLEKWYIKMCRDSLGF
jgi:hypothetical protein